MEFRIAPSTAAYIAELLAMYPDKPDEWISARAEVSKIHVRRVRRGEPLTSNHAEIIFRHVRPYTCPTCERRICLRPCPACMAQSRKVRSGKFR